MCHFKLLYTTCIACTEGKISEVMYILYAYFLMPGLIICLSIVVTRMMTNQGEKMLLMTRLD